MSPCACCPPVSPPMARHALSRRRAIFSALAGTGLACMGLPAPRARAASPLPPTSLNPDQALAALMEGNRRFVAGEVTPISRDPARRALLASGQAPFAAVLGCADSRAAPELVFHTGLGEIFVVRNAGNIADNGAIGSLEYAIGVLGVPLVMVLGHARCGAADAAVTMARDETSLPTHLRDMLLPLLPSALAANRAGGDALEGTIRRNVARMAASLVSESPVIGAAVANGRVRVVGGYYNLDSEAVTVLA